MTATEQKFKLIELNTIDSTNNHAMNLIRENKAEHGLAVFAEHQTAGKGQRGKAWNDEAGESINCSLIIEPAIYQIVHPFHLIAATACAIRKVIEATIRHPVQIKWPNDIYINDRKAAGILIESVTRGADWKWAVIGFGINVNQKIFSEDLPNPVSLKQLTGREYDIKRLAQDCLNILLRDLSQKNFKEIIAGYNKYLYNRNEKIALQWKESLIYGILSEANEDGALVLEGNKYPHFHPGEVQWLGKA